MLLYHIESFQMADRVGLIDDGWRELEVVGLLQTYDTCFHAACINIERDRNPVISVNHVDPVRLGQIGGKPVEVLLKFC